MTAYEIAAVVRDAHIEVDPALEGKHVRVIILTSESLSDATPARGTLAERVVALQKRFTSLPYHGSEIVDQRRESDR